MTDAGLISGGFYVTRLLEQPAGLARKAPLPERLLTLSSCLTALLPDAWALEWSSCSDEERREALEALRIAPESLGALMRFVTEAFDRGELGWPCVWRSLAAARSVKAAFARADSSLVILELGVPVDYAQELVAQLAQPEGEGDTGVYSC